MYPCAAEQKGQECTWTAFQVRPLPTTHTHKTHFTYTHFKPSSMTTAETGLSSRQQVAEACHAGAHRTDALCQPERAQSTGWPPSTACPHGSFYLPLCLCSSAQGQDSVPTSTAFQTQIQIQMQTSPPAANVPVDGADMVQPEVR